MKKSFKFLSLAFFMLSLLVLPLLSGCSKTHVVEVSIEGGYSTGGGIVTYNKGSVHGKNAVAANSNFEFTITPNTGYEIASISIDNEPYQRKFAKTGTTITIENITTDVVINVSFTLKTYSVLIRVCDIRNGTNYGFVDYDTITVKHGETLDLSLFGENIGDVFYYNKKAQDGTILKQYLNTSEGPRIYADGFVVFTEKTASYLDSLIVDNAID